MKNFYQLIAPFYDRFNGEVDHVRWSDFAETCFSRFSGRVESVLDLGTGTGSLAIELARRGYDLIGIDASEEMLSIARMRADKENLSEILWLCQNMTEFELYGTVDAVVSSLDCVNHLLDRADVEACFSLVHNYLVPDGLFLFDINSPYKFKEIYGNRSYVLEEENTLCVWQNYYRKSSGLCDFYISLFTREEDGLYRREDTLQQERMYSPRILKKILEGAGFEWLGIWGDTDGALPREEDERLYILARAVKNKKGEPV